MKHLLYSAIFLVGLLSAMQAQLVPAAAIDPIAIFEQPRPIGVADDASPGEKGREILRVTIELVRHGDLRDTDFASRLLQLPIVAGKGFQSPNMPPFPQQLARHFGYSLYDAGVVREAVSFMLNPDEVCLRLDDFVAAFKKEFGVGTDIFRGNSHPPFRVIPFDRGWTAVEGVHKSNTSEIYQAMPNKLVVSFAFDSRCGRQIGIQRHSVN